MTWHKVAEELPEKGKMVLLYKGKNSCDFSICKFGYLSHHYDRTWFILSEEFYPLNYFTDWIAVKPPEEDE